MAHPLSRTLLVTIAMISGAAIAYEILLTRIFAMVHWQHMVAIAIGLALLGYGASGTFITLTARYLGKRFDVAFAANALLFTISSLVCVTLAQRWPFDPQSVAWQLRAITPLAAGFLILAIPFFAAANCVALTLSQRVVAIPVVYGADLLGAGLGAVLLTVALAFLPPAATLIGVAGVGAVTAITVAIKAGWSPGALLLTAAVLPLTLWLTGPIKIESAPYKDLARSLSITGAEVLLEHSAVNGTVTVVDNHQVPVREAPGLSLYSAAELPHQLAVFVDGDAAGVIDRFDATSEGTAYLDDLLTSIPYRLLHEPKVAHLHAGLGRGVSQALQLGATHVVAVEANPLLIDLVCSDSVNANPRHCDTNWVSWRSGNSRAFAIATSERFDLIHFPTSSDNAGLDALDIEFDLTVEAFVQYLSHLNAGGLLVIEGPSRLPPRQSIRMLAIAKTALMNLGVQQPSTHLALLRGWQRFLLLASIDPLSTERISAIRTQAENGGYDLAWLPQLQIQDTNQYQQLDAPHYYLAARQLLDPVDSQAGLLTAKLTAGATDDRPFPHRYSSWRSIGAALFAEDPQRLAAEDTALLVGGLILLLAILISLLLILLPVGVLSYKKAQGIGRLGTRIAIYFGLTGLAFLAIEIGWIQALGLFLDHPIYATAIVLSGFLIFAGLGSLWAQRFRTDSARALLTAAVAGILLGGGIYLLWLSELLSNLAAQPFALRVAISIALLAPLAFAMGIPFPVGLKYFGVQAPSLVPWAWGVNGCASVISAVGSPLLMLNAGFSGLMGLALLAYFVLPWLVLAQTKEASTFEAKT